MESIFLSVVIPVYDEEAALEKVIRDHIYILQTIHDSLRDWEIVCLDDASTDRSLEILKRLSATETRLKVIRHERNRGIYESFNDLFHSAKGDYIYATASDGQWPAENLVRLLRASLNGNYDLVIGVRKNRREIYSIWRRLLSFLFNWLPMLIFGVRTEDANSIKFGKRELFTIQLLSNSFFAEVERIIEANRNGKNVGFEPIEFLPRGTGKASGAKWRNIWSTLRDLCGYTLKRGTFIKIKA